MFDIVQDKRLLNELASAQVHIRTITFVEFKKLVAESEFTGPIRARVTAHEPTAVLPDAVTLRVDLKTGLKKLQLFIVHVSHVVSAPAVKKIH